MIYIKFNLINSNLYQILDMTVKLNIHTINTLIDRK